jgi:hypothetical protein
VSRVGLVVNPAAGRDIRRLTGGASVVDNYAKRRIAECVLEGLTAVPEPLAVRLMPDRAGIADHVLEEAPEVINVATLETTVEGSSADTRRAAARFREDGFDAVVVLGGDGTTRDVASELGEVPMIAVATGTNTVVPSAVDGTVAGVAAALIATGIVPAAEATMRHGMIEARAETASGEKRLSALAASEVSSRSFVGSRALLDPGDLVGGVVSRAHPGDIGLPAVAGAVEPLAPDESGGVALRLTEPENASRTVRAVLAPGVVASVGIASIERVGWDGSVEFDVPDGVVGADGERELELTDATVEFRVTREGPRLVDVDAALAAGAEAGAFDLEAGARTPATED